MFYRRVCKSEWTCAWSAVACDWAIKRTACCLAFSTWASTHCRSLTPNLPPLQNVLFNLLNPQWGERAETISIYHTSICSWWGKHNSIRTISFIMLEDIYHKKHTSRVWQISIKLSRNLHKHQFEGNMTMNAVITLWELLTKCQTIIFIMNSSEELPWLPTDFVSSWQWV